MPYSFPVQIGSQSIIFYSKLDVNFDNFIVTRSGCKTVSKTGAKVDNCPQKVVFDPTKSTTAKELNK